MSYHLVVVVSSLNYIHIIIYNRFFWKLIKLINDLLLKWFDEHLWKWGNLFCI